LRGDTSKPEENACGSPSLLSSRLQSNSAEDTKTANVLKSEWAVKVETILKFVRHLTSILATQVDAPTIAL